LTGSAAIAEASNVALWAGYQPSANPCARDGVREPGTGGDGAGAGDEMVGESAVSDEEAGSDGDDDDLGRGMACDVGDGAAETGDDGLLAAAAEAELNAEAHSDGGGT